jgi:hypothetical protein
MTYAVEPKYEFRNLSEGAVLAALENPTDPTNVIAVEIGRLILNYMAYFRKHSRFPDGNVEGRCPIEQVAMKLTFKAISENEPR